MAALDQAVLSLTQGRIDLRKLDVHPPLGAPLTVARIDLEFSWRALLAGRFEIAELAISGLELRLERTREGHWRLPFPEATPDAAPSAVSEPVALGIARLVASDGRITLVDGARTLVVGVERFDVSGFDLRRPGQATRFDLDATLAGGRVRAIGEAKPLASVPEGAATLRVAGVALAPLAPFLGVELAGTLDGEVSGRFTAAGLELRGGIVGARLRVPGVAAEALEWNGTFVSGPQGEDIQGAFSARGLASDPLRAAEARFEGRVRLSPELAVEGHATIDAVALADTDRRLETARIEARGLSVRHARDRWIVSSVLDVQNAALRDAAGEVSLDALRADSLAVEWGAAGGRATASFAARGLAYAAPDLRGRIETLGSAGVTLQMGDAATLSGRLETARAELDMAGLAARADALALDLKHLVLRPSPAAEFRLAVSGPAIEAPDFGVRARSLAVEGSWTDGRFVGPASAEAPTLDLKSAKIGARAARLAGDVAYDVARAALEGRVRFAELRVGRADGLDLAEIGALALDGIAVSDRVRRVAGVLAERVRVLRREAAPAFPWRLEAPRLEIGGVALAPDGALRVGPVRARGTVLRVTRTATGLASLDAILAGGDSAAAPGPGFRVESVAIDDSRLEFEDRAPATTVRVDADRVSVRLGALDTMAPNAPTRAALRARVAGAGTLDLQGEITPLAPQIGFDLTATARGIDIPPFSPYVADALGVDFRTGRFDLDLRLAARAEALSGTSQWRIQNLEIDERGTDALAREAGAPVAMALGFLRDGQGDIALDVPIAGKLRDPTFDASDAVRQAVGGAIRGALSTTFNVLFPFGFIFGALVDGQTHPTLPPIAFAPGLASLDARATASLDALAGVLAGRPAARLDLCGFAGPADLRALNAARGTDARGQELVATLRRLFSRATGAAPNAAGEDELRALAEDRARAVKERLADRPGVDASRLFECRPVVESASDAAPRVELKF